MDKRVSLTFLHADGVTYTWRYRVDALYAILREGGWPEEVEMPLYVLLPSGIRWHMPEGERYEQALALASMLRPLQENS